MKCSDKKQQRRRRIKTETDTLSDMLKNIDISLKENGIDISKFDKEYNPADPSYEEYYNQFNA